MIKDGQVRILMTELQDHRLELAAAKSGMSEKTARKYRRAARLPSDMKAAHTWRTRQDPFTDVWEQVERLLDAEPTLQANTLFAHLQEQFPGRFPDGQLRSLQRRIKVWRATRGPDKEVFFEQEHIPGELGQSDFCHADRLGVTIAGQPFDHLLYHFVLTYSNWEYARVCFSESLESLSEGLQGALTRLGGAPRRHRTDSLTAAVHNIGQRQEHREEFTQRYRGLIAHYGIEAEHTQPASPNENGDVEQSHHRFLMRIDQALMLRGSRQFATREQYEEFLRVHSDRANQGRLHRFEQERACLRSLPAGVYDAAKRLSVRVSAGATIRVQDNVYGVPSRLIGERVDVVVRSETVEIFYAQKLVVRLARLRGKGGHSVDYRNVIDWLVRKPGAFDGYVYRDALFPTSRFRIAYDLLTRVRPQRGKKEYLLILQMAARQGQTKVDDALRQLETTGQPISLEGVKAVLASAQPAPPAHEVRIAPVNLVAYDALLSAREVAHA
jgi:transposase